jgi:hypothetical protein
MSYAIKCVCGDTITVEAECEADAVTKLVAEMNRHLAATAHPMAPRTSRRNRRR